jgi:osmotically-inducible protein OsmY
MARDWRRESYYGPGTGWRAAGRPRDWEYGRDEWTRWGRHPESYGRAGGYESEWGYPRGYGEEDDETYRRAGPSRGYVGGEPNQGYVGFGPDQGFWRSSGPYERSERGYRDEDWRQGRGYEGRRGERSWWDRATDEVASWVGDEDAERRRRMDEMRSHRGRGPRGYTRSDDRIKEDVSDRLTDDPYVDASDIEVTVAGCEVTLNGTVNGRAARRRAEDIAEDVSGVRHVQNNLRVREGWTQSGATAPTSAESAPTKVTEGTGKDRR